MSAEYMQKINDVVNMIIEKETLKHQITKINSNLERFRIETLKFDLTCTMNNKNYCFPDSYILHYIYKYMTIHCEDADTEFVDFCKNNEDFVLSQFRHLNEQIFNSDKMIEGKAISKFAEYSYPMFVRLFNFVSNKINMDYINEETLRRTPAMIGIDATKIYKDFGDMLFNSIRRKPKQLLTFFCVFSECISEEHLDKIIERLATYKKQEKVIMCFKIFFENIEKHLQDTAACDKIKAYITLHNIAK